jgi:small subunit ribosomal protein S18
MPETKDNANTGDHATSPRPPQGGGGDRGERRGPRNDRGGYGGGGGGGDRGGGRGGDRDDRGGRGGDRGGDRGDRGDMGGGRRPRRFHRGKVCQFCVEKSIYIDYKDLDRLRSYVTDTGKILPRRITGACARHQRMVTNALKRARVMALLPFKAR